MLASCFHEDYSTQVVETIAPPQLLHATVEKETDEDPDTKVYLNSDRRIRWDAGDRIAVYYATTQKSKYKFLGETGDAGGDFEYQSSASTTPKDLNDGLTYAAYPYKAATSITQSGILTLNLPAEQTYRAGSFGEGANTMVSVSEQGVNDFSFKNMGGFLCFKLYGNDGVYINSITLTGNNGEKLAGKAKVTSSIDGVPELEWQSDATESITLVCDPPVAVGNSKTNYTEFWMVVPPTTFTKGFTLTVRGGGGIKTQSLTTSVTIRRNYISKMAPLKVPYHASSVYSIRSRESMTLKQKVGQMLMVQDYAILYYNGTGYYETEMTTTLQNRFNSYPCGGFILKAENVISPSQLTQYTADLHALADYPMLSIDEEGGRVARIGLGGKGKEHTAEFGEICTTNASRQAQTVGDTGDPANAYASGNYIGKYLRKYGLDVNLAPVADVNSNPNNPVINNRSFGSNPTVVAQMVAAYLHGLQDAGVEGCLKHFPGHGDTGTDSHYGYSEVNKTWSQMLQCEIVPFKRGIDENARMIMTAHITLPKVMPSNNLVPSTLSYLILHDKLRVELGFDGVIITDSMGMAAITKQFSSRKEAAILAILAGADIVLGPADSYEKYKEVFNGIVSAVQSGRIPESRINESVDRILEMKRHILAERGQLK